MGHSYYNLAASDRCAWNAGSCSPKLIFRERTTRRSPAVPRDQSLQRRDAALQALKSQLAGMDVIAELREPS